LHHLHALAYLYSSVFIRVYLWLQGFSFVQSSTTPRAILFDFDGTFADTAPDMAFAANMLRKAHGLDTLPVSNYRPHVSRGARGMIGVAFKVMADEPEFPALKDGFLNIYEKNLCVHTTIFDGINELVAECERRDIAWGIVTNKAKRFTDPITRALGLDVRAGCIVSGDTTPHAKPHPAPLLHAADLIAIDAADCWYVGDDIRDIQAAHAAGMKGVVARYGYLGGSDPNTWNGDIHIDSPLALLDYLDRTSALEKHTINAT
jgi:N-acetyl-D-muramate 6-phosphate phosphatase